jgi:hypothetical protein
MYENYQADPKNLERGLMKSKLLVMVSSLIFKLTFTSSHSRGLKPYSLRPPPLTKSTVMAMVQTSLKTTDVPENDPIKPKLRPASHPS